MTSLHRLGGKVRVLVTHLPRLPINVRKQGKRTFLFTIVSLLVFSTKFGKFVFILECMILVYWVMILYQSKYYSLTSFVSSYAFFI